MLRDFTVFDFETTSTDYRKDQAVEVAAIRVIDGVEVATFSTLVRLTGRAVFDPKAQEITGLNPGMLQNAMKEKAAFEMLHELTRGDTVLVAHNILFDYAFLHHGLLRAGLPAPAHNFLCTLTICRNRQPGPHKLVPMCAAYGVEQLPAHQALSDVRMTLGLLRALDAEGNTNHYLNRAGWDGRWSHPTWYPNHARLVKQRVKHAPKPALEMPSNHFRQLTLPTDEKPAETTHQNPS